jgi:NAD+ kinase
MNKIGCCYHPKLAGNAGERLAHELLEIAGRRVEATWLAPAWDEEAMRAELPDTDLLLCVGGDGTVLRAARAVVPHQTLLLGVNMGRLGFLTEFDANEARDRLPEVLDGAGRVEQRAMLHAEIETPNGGGAPPDLAHHDALNDVVIGRATLGRTVQIAVSVDGTSLAEYRADGVIIATATGSTAYSLSVGGPVLPTESREILLTPLAPHFAPRNSIVLPPESVVEIEIAGGQEAALSIDGEPDLLLAVGERMRVAQGPHIARFLRLSTPSRFYERIAHRLSWVREAREHVSLPEEAPA